MAATDRFILPQDVVIAPVSSLDAALLDKLACAGDEFAVSRQHSRTPSRIVDADTAALLDEFRAPRTIVEAIISFSQARARDPQAVLADAFPILQRLCQSRLLLPAESAQARQIEPAYAEGEPIDGFEVLRCVQVLEDSEVYQVRDSERLIALKIAREGAGRGVEEALARETCILKHLDGRYSPALVAEGAHAGRRYLAMEWCDGASAASAAEEQRCSEAADAPARLLDLCCAILAAYAHLHAQGVIHADVHPRNVLIGASGVKIVDFGLARFATPGSDAEPRRGGVGFYFEPEYAAAYLSGAPAPAASMPSEQYALGALLYLLLSGRQYLDFSPEKQQLFRQIAEDAPLPFSRQGLDPWPEVEQALARALSKNPAERFASVEEFARQLGLAAASARARAPRPAGRLAAYAGRAAGAALVEATLARLGAEGQALRSGLPLAPACSVNFGAAGVAYMFYRIACLRGDARLLATADLWTNRARRDRDSPRAFLSAELGMSEETIGPISLYHTASGVHYVQALISQAMGDTGSARAAVQSFVAASSQPCANLDLTLGRSSTLLGCALLREAIPAELLAGDTSLAALGQQTLDGIWSELGTYAPIDACRELSWLGMAHGWAGLLYATLHWCEATGSAPPEALGERLRQLAGLAQPAGRGLAWRRGWRDPAAWPGWCHGSAGYVHLWLLAGRVLRDEAFTGMAERAAWHAWEHSEHSGGNLCCGLTGMAYALLSLYNAGGDREWLARARELGARAVADAASPRLRSNSLYKGDVGIALLAAELAQPESARMPLFEAEG